MGTPEAIYTVQSGSTVVMLGLTLANVHTAQVTASVTLESTTTQTGQTQNTTAFLIKDYNPCWLNTCATRRENKHECCK